MKLNKRARINYWSCSRFADWIRGTNKPFALEWDDWDTWTEEAKKKLEEVRAKNDNPKNLEEWIVSQVGIDIYTMFIKGYTTKQWGRHPNDLPASIIKRLPVRFNHDDNYFNDTYQGIPIGGYTQIFEKLLNGIEVKLNTDYLQNRESFNNIAKKVIYTGPIDAYYNYRFGKLDYRSLKFETERVDVPDYQGNAVINYTELHYPETRIVEHKHFDPVNTDFTYITREYPREYGEGLEPYYPVNDKVNTPTYDRCLLNHRFFNYWCFFYKRVS